ncbi:Lipoprotein [Pararobbsia alpina]|uniref:YXWGXW repeat-containing protein n=1 Tax=Pararobbsia alpina TaxID=621374 RepID=UPI0039A560E1
MMKKLTLSKTAFVIGASALLLSACYVEPARPPMPAERVEVVPVAPGEGFVWVKGHYKWEGGAWVWVPGHWRRV